MAACQVYFLFVQCLLTRFHQVADQRKVVFAPQNREHDFLKVLPNAWQLTPQSNGDLGDRLSHYFEQVVVEEKVHLVVIGGDCLEITSDHVESAFRALQTHDVVIGPTTDGGYYLIGMSTFIPEAFQNIDWSTESVFEQTMKQFDEQNATVHQMPTLNDVDDKSDFDQLLQWLTDSADSSEQSALLLNNLKAAIKS